MVRDPAFFLLGEPLSNVDARTRLIARGLLKVQQELGQTFVSSRMTKRKPRALPPQSAFFTPGSSNRWGRSTMYERPSTKWVGYFLGEFPINFLPSSFVGKGPGREVCFILSG
jgi:ABC-type sugar transport system ATPase subunit